MLGEICDEYYKSAISLAHTSGEYLSVDHKMRCKGGVYVQRIRTYSPHIMRSLWGYRMPCVEGLQAYTRDFLGRFVMNVFRHITAFEAWRHYKRSSHEYVR